MLGVISQIDDDYLILKVKGNIDPDNADEFAKKLIEARQKNPEKLLKIDLSETEKISGPGLQALLELQRGEKRPVTLCNVPSDVMENINASGMSDLFRISEVIKDVQVSENDLIGHFGTTRIYKLGNDKILKVYADDTSAEQVICERRRGRVALKYGVPSLLSYEIVRCNGFYGLAGELSNSRSVSSLIRESPVNITKCGMLMGQLLKKIHSVKVNPEDLPDINVLGHENINKATKYLHPKEIGQIMSMINSIPESDYMIHGNFSSRYAFVHGDHCMAGGFMWLARGNYLFDLGVIYMTHILCGEFLAKPLTGIEADDAKQLCQMILQSYAGDSFKYKKMLPAIHAVGLLNLVLFPVMFGLGEDLTEKFIALSRRDLFPVAENVINVLSNLSPKDDEETEKAHEQINK